jgi:recombination protein RecA
LPRPQLIRRAAPIAEHHVNGVAVLETLETGSTLLNLGNSGGWALGRIINIVGDTSSGKTLLAIEAAINFAARFEASSIRYNETEAAFDRAYAYSLGFPLDATFTGDDDDSGHGSVTVEDLFADIERHLARHPEGPSLYIVDSLDATSDVQEMGNVDLGKATMGRKAKMLSEFFRRMTKPLAKARCCLMIVSQVRDKIGVTFGETKMRAGGHALDFFASQIVWLYESGKIRRTVSGVERVVGINVRFRNKKNKLGTAFAEGEIVILFNYGVDDELSMSNWLKKNKLGDANLSMAIEQIPAALTRARNRRDMDALQALRNELRLATTARWREIDTAMSPPLRKYN